MRKRCVILYARSHQWAEFASRAEDPTADASFEPIKDEGKTRAGFIAAPAGTLAFIKRFDGGSWSRGLWARVRGSRARRSIQAAALLQSHGFRCPQPHAAWELRSGGSVSASYLLSEALGAAKTLSVFVHLRRRARGAEVGKRRAILSAVAREIRRLHDVGLFSSDLQETNLMLEDADGAPKIYFVDLADFRQRRRIRWPLRERNLVQLDRSIGRFLTRTARLRFLYAYLGGSRERREARAIVARILERKAREDRKREARRASERARRSTCVPAPQSRSQI
jgi:RIO-like serine/threonine protein kinase